MQSGTSLVFDASNWNTNQTVTLSAASDADQVDGSAIIRCSAPETADKDVTATEEDNTPALAIVTSTNAVTVAEGGTAELPGQAEHRSAESHDGDGQPGQRGYGHQRAVGRIAGVRRLQLEYEPDGDAGGGVRCGPGRRFGDHPVQRAGDGRQGCDGDGRGQHTGAGDRDEHECGDGGGRRYGRASRSS